jgi:hypothetical protein
VKVALGYPERYWDGDASAFRYRQKRYETWWENGKKYGRWEWVPAVWDGAWMDG